MAAAVGNKQLEALVEGAVNNLQQEISEKDRTIALLMKQIEEQKTTISNLDNIVALGKKELSDETAKADALNRSLMVERAEAAKDRAEITQLRNNYALAKSKAALVDQILMCLEAKKKMTVPPLTQDVLNHIHPGDRPVYEDNNRIQFERLKYKETAYGSYYSDIIDTLTRPAAKTQLP